jgi:hypothetical protein
MADWSGQFEDLLGDLGKQIRGVARAVGAGLRDDPIEVLAYRGFGNAGRAHVYGRALEKRNVNVSTDSDSVFRNLLNTYRRAEADPVPFAQLQIEYGEMSTLLLPTTKDSSAAGLSSTHRCQATRSGESTKSPSSRRRRTVPPGFPEPVRSSPRRRRPALVSSVISMTLSFNHASRISSRPRAP